MNQKETNIIDDENTVHENEVIKVEDNKMKSKDVDESSFITSLCNHETMYFEHHADSSDFLVSMVSHQQHIQEESIVDASSMVCHHSTENPNLEDLLSITTEYSGEKELFEEDVNDAKSKTFSSTLLAHQLPVADTPDEFPMLPVSMATHIVTDLDETFHSSSTMLVHQNTNDYIFSNIQRNTENDDSFELAVPIVYSEMDLEEESCVRVTDQCTEDLSALQLFSEQQEQQNCQSENSVEDVKRDDPCIDPSLDEYAEDNDRIVQTVSAETVIVQELFFLPSMVVHQLPYLETPVEHTEFLSSSASHRYLPTDSEDISLLPSMLAYQYLEQKYSNTNIEEYEDKENEHFPSLVSHQLSVTGVNNENRELLISAVSHNIQTDEQNKLIDDYSMIGHQIYNNTDEDKIGNSEKENRLPISDKDITPKSDDSWIEGYKVEDTESKLITSLVSHQLPGSDATNENKELLITSLSHNITSDEPPYSTTLGSESSMLVHHVDDKTVKEKAMTNKSDEFNIQTSIPVIKNKTESNAVRQAENEIINSKEKLVEFKINSYTEGSVNNQKEKICHTESPVGMDDTNETNDNLENVALNSYTSKLTRIQKLQRLVEDEIEEFENKRKNNIKHIENDVETTETNDNLE